MNMSEVGNNAVNIEAIKNQEFVLTHEDVETLVETFRTLLKWSKEQDINKPEKSDGCNYH